MIGFVTPAQVIAVAEAVITTQRDWGNRAERKRSRLKYTIDDRGLDTFKAEVERRAGFALAACASHSCSSTTATASAGSKARTAAGT